MDQLGATYAFMTADFKGLLADVSPEAVAELEWLLPTATKHVERMATVLGISEWALLQRRHEVEDPVVQHALDILEAGGFIVPNEERDS
jgi:hypothetical protein